VGDRLRVLLVEPYFTGSHRAWAEGLVTHSTHDVRLVTHAGGFWKWRMQGAALTLAADIERAVAGWGRPDVLLVSSMVHVPALVGLARRALDGTPVVVYLHENQLSYPLPEGETADLTYAMTNWLSVAAADRVVFNSEFHRRDFFDRLPAFLNQFPDHRHGALIDAAREKAVVLPIGIDAPRFAGGRSDAVDGPPVILWNHRWEYDKDPEAFFAALTAVARDALDFRVIVAGTQFQTVPAVFDDARRALGSRIAHFGTASDAQYPDLLARADIVISTARHEFFGVAMAEAITAGALPLLPNRLAYPELVPSPDPYLYDGDDDLVGKLAWAITDAYGRRTAAVAARGFVGRFAWSDVAPRYDAFFDDTARSCVVLSRSSPQDDARMR
jgi:glycosyltransferase involved in cell wall biosynthesis